MRIPKYWAMSVERAQDPGGKWLRLVCWGWSDTSDYDARRNADDRTRELAQKVAAGLQLNRYAYSERPLREEIVEGVKNWMGGEVGVVTRNAYGARVLNAVNAMFIDIDLPEPGTPRALANQLQSKLRPGPGGPADPYLQRIAAWAGQHPGVGLRVYRTYAGLRCLVTNQVLDPSHPESLAILQAMGSDPLYVTLCRAQGCFRARLTPKPWRVGMHAPAWRYPWQDSRSEMRFRDWEREYEHRSMRYSVCTFITQFGPAETHPDVAPVLALHDQLTCPPGERPLA